VESETLSIVIPTANRQDQIAERVETLIDHVADLCERLQIVVVDDASSDATPEILEELQRIYPQVEIIRNNTRKGPKHAAEIGLDRAIGTFVFIQDSYDSVDVRAMQQLWSLRNDRNLVVARAGTRTRRIDNALLEQLAKWGQRIDEQWTRAAGDANTITEMRAVSGGLQMVRRDALSKVARVDSQEPAFEVSHLSQRSLVRSSKKLAT
jgi:glycosyltransferase involved in cell wall biosynthesis